MKRREMTLKDTKDEKVRNREREREKRTRWYMEVEV